MSEVLVVGFDSCGNAQKKRFVHAELSSEGNFTVEWVIGEIVGIEFVVASLKISCNIWSLARFGSAVLG